MLQATSYLTPPPRLPLRPPAPEAKEGGPRLSLPKGGMLSQALCISSIRLFLRPLAHPPSPL